MSITKPWSNLDQNQEINNWVDFSKIDKVDPEQEAKLKKNFSFLFEEWSDKRLPPEQVNKNLEKDRETTKKSQEEEASKLMAQLNWYNEEEQMKKGLGEMQEIFSMILEQNWDKLTKEEVKKIKEFQWRFDSNLTQEDAKAIVEEMDSFFIWLQESWRFDNDKFLKIDQDTRPISEKLKDAGKGSADQLKKSMPWLYDDNYSYDKEKGDSDLNDTEKEESTNNTQESLSEKEQIESRKEGLKFAEEGLQTNTLWSYLWQLEDIKTFDENYYNDLMKNIKDRSSFKNAQKNYNFLDWFLWFHIIMLWQILRSTKINDNNKKWVDAALKSLIDLAEESGFYNLDEDKWGLVKKELKKLSQWNSLEYEEMDTLAKNIWEWELKARNNWNSSRIREFAIKMWI